MTFVPYPGTPPAVNALLGGHVTSYFGNYSVVAEQLRAGRLRALATAARTRIEPLPDVPTAPEAGLALGSDTTSRSSPFTAILTLSSSTSRRS